MPDEIFSALCGPAHDKAAAQSAPAANLPALNRGRGWVFPGFPGLPAVFFQKRRASCLREKSSTGPFSRAVPARIPGAPERRGTSEIAARSVKKIASGRIIGDNENDAYPLSGPFFHFIYHHTFCVLTNCPRRPGPGRNQDVRRRG